ncbi:MAG: hypothetical protein IJG33_09015 [Selenomonadaceae bacterium]|nr:hypothetical protein [Selenomonadaceae bacterium]
MAEAQVLNPDAIDETKPITFAPREWFFFKSEINDQLAEGKGVDILKALRAARFYAQIERSTEQYKQGKVVSFTEEEWEDFVNAQNLH